LDSSSSSDRDEVCVNAVGTSCVACQKSLRWHHPPGKWCSQSSGITKPQGHIVNAYSYCNILRKLRKAIQRKRPGLTGSGKSLPGSDRSPKNFMLLVFRGLWNDRTSASMYREIMLRNKSICQISTLVCLSSISICNLLTYLRIFDNSAGW
jgi:hypothetical protein